MTIIERLQAWYHSHCDGEWEHGHGVHITTLDNPGWSVRINLRDTELLLKPFQEITQYDHERDWICCYIKDDEFHGAGGPCMLDELLKTFLLWAES